jgi:hypothetical protein
VVVERTAHAGSENVCTTCFTYDPVGARIQFLLTLPPPALGRQAPLVKTCCDTYGPMQEELDVYVVTVLKYCSAHVSGQNVGESVGESVGDNVGASVGAAVGESVGDAVGAGMIEAGKLKVYDISAPTNVDDQRTPVPSCPVVIEIVAPLILSWQQPFLL